MHDSPHATQEPFLVQAIERGHDSRISNFQLAMIDQFANRGVFARPKFLRANAVPAVLIV